VRDLGTTLEPDEGVRAGDVVILNPPVDLEVDLEDGGKVALREPATASRWT